MVRSGTYVSIVFSLPESVCRNGTDDDDTGLETAPFGYGGGQEQSHNAFFPMGGK